MWLKLSGASDCYPQLLWIPWKINYIWTIEKGTMGQYEKHESDILGQRAWRIYKNKIKEKKEKRLESRASGQPWGYGQYISLYG